MSNKNILLVPIQLDALFVAAETMVTEAFADFSHLPYCKDRKDHNPDTANISESILSTPFQNQNLNLGSGMHLHWTLPAALTKGGTNGSPLSYPAVPDRWLVTRKVNNKIEKQWVVESDYLQYEAEDATGIAFPDFNPGETSPQPFSYLGRQLDYAGWKEDPAASRLPRLTAMGYGEPAFAAFYPNCHSVFGCYDADITTERLQGLSYQVIGWYSHPELDPFHELIGSDEFRKCLFQKMRKPRKPGEPEPETNPVQDFFKQKLGWQIPVTDKDIDKLPETMYCYCQLNVEPAKMLLNEPRQKEVSLSIGNTGTEAMSAYLANIITNSSDDTIRTEEQLESLLAYRVISSKELDAGPRFQEARHEKSFKAEKGGHIWQIRHANEDNNNSAKNDKQEVVIDLPASIADLLNTLNEQQQTSDELAALLRYRKHLLFADWYKYMLCAYPPDDDRNDYPDIDVVKNYIEQTLLIEPAKVIDPAVLPILEERIRQFNESDIPVLLNVKLHKKDNAAIPAALTIDKVAEKWVENLPFSAWCLQFNTDSNNKGQVTVSLANNESIKGISVWINLAARQADEAVLLATKNKGVQIGKTAIAGELYKVAINGTFLSASGELPWRRFPGGQWFHLYVEWDTLLEKDDIIYLFANNNAAFLNGKLASLRLFEKTVSADELQCDMNILGHHQYALKAVAGPRYWQPAEPVIMLEGEAVKPTNRFGTVGGLSQNNILPCQIANVVNYPLQQSDFTTLLTEISKGKPAKGENKPGFNTWSTQPWNPFLLEWQVEVKPMEEAGNLATDNRDFEPGFITTNFHLPANSAELSLTTGKNTTPAAATYTGRSILTPHSKTRFLKAIEDYFTQLKVDDCYQALVPPPNQKEKQTYLGELEKWFAHKPTLPGETYTQHRTWYLEKPVYNNAIQKFEEVFTEETARLKDCNYTLLQAALQLMNSHFLSQALSGFNNALLMLHQTLQLPVTDPLDFPEYKNFTNRIKDAVAGNNNLAPMPHNDFLPIRSGAMTINRLRIIDSFGQGKEISIDKFFKAASLSNKDFTNDAWLPPRFVPPARINFRWLSALRDNQVMNTLSQDNPICGWLLANHLDTSVMVYDREGHLFGYIDQQATWRTAPGCPVNYQADDITNPHLRKIVKLLCLSHGANAESKHNKIEFLQHFITATDNALENIHPETDILHQEMALLMGKPMAVVRATIGLQLKEGPPVHHGWVEFLKDLERDTRSTNKFEKVKVPVRLGDRDQLNDGLVGYWIEDEQYELGSAFYTTGNNDQETQQVQIKSTAEPGNPDLQLTFEKASAKTLCMLVYAPGEVHATTGMLPVKAIHIPKEQYTPALKNMHITFLTAPVLTDKELLTLPLPKEMGYEWSWLAKERYTWVEVAQHGIVRKDSARTVFANGAELWEHLLQKGWILEIDENRAGIVPADQRSAPTLDDPFNKQTDVIQHWLDAGHIIPAETKATFGRQLIREGWLKLKPS